MNSSYLTLLSTKVVYFTALGGGGVVENKPSISWVSNPRETREKHKHMIFRERSVENAMVPIISPHQI